MACIKSDEVNLYKEFDKMLVALQLAKLKKNCFLNLETINETPV